MAVFVLTFDVAQVIQLQGDQRKNVSTFLVQVISLNSFIIIVIVIVIFF